MAAISHQQIWAAIDALADRFGLTTSALARSAGLDPTSFNRSKRIMGEDRDGRPRWPSTESVAKVLDATGVTFGEFARLATGRDGKPRGVPLIGLAQAGSDGFFDDAGYPLGEGWDEIEAPGMADAGAYALEISGDSMAPVYRDGDRIIVTPTLEPRRGDRVVVKTTEGEVLAKEVARLTSQSIELKSLNEDYPGRTLARKDLAWIARIVWASQ